MVVWYKDFWHFEILSLKDKSEVIKILDDTINMHSDEAVKENARSVKSLLALS